VRLTVETVSAMILRGESDQAIVATFRLLSYNVRVVSQMIARCKVKLGLKRRADEHGLRNILVPEKQNRSQVSR
jgi:hypothetical protein